jgi:opacity protein-like surface antigen
MRPAKFRVFMKLSSATVAACGLAMLAMAGVAQAGDPAPRWGGAYIGLGVGGLGFGGTEIDTHTVPPHIDKYSGGPSWGVLGTVTAGYDLKLAPGIIVGGFAEFDVTNASFKLTSPDGDINRLRERSAFNVGGRLGTLIMPDTLLFAAAGYTRANFKFSYSDEYSNGRMFDGWFTGGGIEQKFGGPWSIKVEYRFAHYGRQVDGNDDGAGGGGGGGATDQQVHSIDANSHSVRLGINYTFGQ